MASYKGFLDKASKGRMTLDDSGLGELFSAGELDLTPDAVNELITRMRPGSPPEREVLYSAAAVYVDDGQRMTAWTREGAEALPEALTSASAPFGSDLVITRPIASPEGAVGTLVVRYSTADVVARTWRFLAIAGFVLLVSILLASLAAGRLQREGP